MPPQSFIQSRKRIYSQNNPEATVTRHPYVFIRAPCPEGACCVIPARLKLERVDMLKRSNGAGLLIGLRLPARSRHDLAALSVRGLSHLSNLFFGSRRRDYEGVSEIAIRCSGTPERREYNGLEVIVGHGYRCSLR